MLLALQALKKLGLTVDQSFRRFHLGCALQLLLIHDKLLKKTRWLMSLSIWVGSQPCDISKLNTTVGICIIRQFFVFSPACSLFHPLRVVSKSWRLELPVPMSRMDMGKICFHLMLDGPNFGRAFHSSEVCFSEKSCSILETTHGGGGSTPTHAGIRKKSDSST